MKRLFQLLVDKAHTCQIEYDWSLIGSLSFHKMKKTNTFQLFSSVKMFPHGFLNSNFPPIWLNRQCSKCIFCILILPCNHACSTGHMTWYDRQRFILDADTVILGYMMHPRSFVKRKRMIVGTFWPSLMQTIYHSLEKNVWIGNQNSQPDSRHSNSIACWLLVLSWPCIGELLHWVIYYVSLGISIATDLQKLSKPTKI